MSAFITPQGDGMFAIKERVDGRERPVAEHFSFDQAKRGLRIYVADGLDGLDEFCAMLGGEDEFDESAVTCSICDGLGHGRPGLPPCPLENRGADEADLEAEMERRLGIIPFDVAMRQAETTTERCECTGVGLTMCSQHANEYQRRYGRAHNE